ncbi:MAG: hypothetical protein V4577_04285 [Bacteroidota bacterium]
MDEYYCHLCNGGAKVSPFVIHREYAKKPMNCPYCGAHIKIGDAVIHVSGDKSDEVKNVSSHLVKQVNDAQLELHKLNEQKLLQKELANNSIKLLLVSGGFWVGSFFAVFYMVFSLATSQVNWYRFIGALFGLPILFTILGAFILRTTAHISEKNFVQLIKLTLNLNFKGLKFLSKPNENDDAKPED